MKAFSLAHLAALWSVPGIGEQSFQRCLLAQKKAEISDEQFWVGYSGVWQNAALSQKQVLSIKNFKKEHDFNSFYEALTSSGLRVLSVRDDDYPNLLKLTDFAPSILFVKSRQKIDQQFWQGLFLAVVGTRRMTNYGRLVIQTLLREVISSQRPAIKVVSGFMYGVDVAAMKLAHQLSQTVGVLGYGFDFCFPRHQQALMTQMLEEGAVFLSEYPPATAPSAGSFVQRNRIIAGLAQATLVIEAAQKSGSLITAQFALDSNRSVMAVPGPISNPYSRGCQQLINDGASLVGTVADFWQALGQESVSPAVTTANSAVNSALLPAPEAKIITSLQLAGGQASWEELLKEGQLNAQDLRRTLFDLELKNLISVAGQNYILKI